MRPSKHKRRASSSRRNLKFMMVMDEPEFRAVQSVAKRRGATVQSVLRAVMIPEWLEHERKKARR
jgi:branched-subunit amino acid aminotransferase/4-amino-4-deoxychorismate lyase